MADSPPAQKDWFLKDWMSHLGRIQAEISKDLGWDRSRVSKVYNGVQPYTRADVNALATWLGIEPFELMIPPRKALALRRLHESAALIVAEEEAVYEVPEAPKRRA